MTVTVDINANGVVYRCQACGAQLTDPPGAPAEHGRAFIAEHRTCPVVGRTPQRRG